ncbi:MAG: 16S rRNA (cytidine(1402)-2'-O)-methyltransferase [Amylibacter sp.]|jgi:16S rRNA (cytidine1402-2'-O)-methyltransferase|nr:16S rRNA (cytidine(1402)-2'-O)-methyltransferase [Amylibacter sp.]MDA8741354.1 16S rRNA (cytidine(1402)-2'-O)-methyltransferase [Amylibacter sp.]MDA8802739.1 16S rRNA (cytidine(1402)-2'-O)-methyltransferase [Amylibacter sp.]MDB2610243.1 16S rRNA (cytidine(1402)-2'-O)-methyltransferase [Amylibacter sp.]MDC0604249.1 16S rRNA (cytidine(1402)-2'-O)-methyltransferase [Amylibacter sp.]|tara:strand:+ start:4671 stop:5540 length:870 start_codon:yes stop_codon:yes gene_type:complete
MTVKKLDSGLHILATPIGTANDITIRALNILRDADILVAEDTRVLRKLMEIHGINLNGRKILSYHDHNGEVQRPKLIALIKEGKVLAYASDAGTPLIADPGFSLTKLAIQNNIRVHAAPGASALLTALCLAGLPTDNFFFGGFLGSKSSQRIKNLQKIQNLDATIVYYESPKRTLSTLKDISKIFGNDRLISVCREMTKKFEEVIRGTVDQVIDEIKSRHSFKGEVVIVLGPPTKKEISDEEIYSALQIALQEYRIKDAATQISEQFGVPKKRSYEMALRIKAEFKKSN